MAGDEIFFGLFAGRSVDVTASVSQSQHGFGDARPGPLGGIDSELVLHDVVLVDVPRRGAPVSPGLPPRTALWWQPVAAWICSMTSS
jgi:hypothetical protein